MTWLEKLTTNPAITEALPEAVVETLLMVAISGVATVLIGGLLGNQLRGWQHLELAVDIHGDGWLLDSLLRNGAHPARDLRQGLAFLHGHVEVDHGSRPFLGIVRYRAG